MNPVQQNIEERFNFNNLNCFSDRSLRADDGAEIK